MLIGGIDVGGTKLAAAIATEDGRILASQRWPVRVGVPPEPALEPAVEWLRRMESVHGAMCAVGMACPGPLSYVEDRLLAVPNMPSWQFFEVGEWLRSKFGSIPHRFMNDANAGVCAEVRFGGAREARSAAFLTFSTGMGAGLWLDGRVYEGPRALAGEVGHLRLEADGPVGFGKAGSVEGFCSGPGIQQLADACRLAAIQRGESVGYAEGASVRDVFVSAVAGDTVARSVIETAGERVGRTCAVLVDLLDLDCIVLGTIGQAWFDDLESAIRRGLEQEALPSLASTLRVLPSPLVLRGELAAIAAGLLELEQGAESGRPAGRARC